MLAPKSWICARWCTKCACSGRNELATMHPRRAISRDAHAGDAFGSSQGRFEYQVEAELIHGFTTTAVVFPPTPALLPAAPALRAALCENQRTARDGDPADRCRLRAAGYAADITAVPVNGGSRRGAEETFTKSCWRRSCSCDKRAIGQPPGTCRTTQR